MTIDVLDRKRQGEEARAKLLAQGYIQLPLGSYYQWILQDWFTKLMLRKLLVKNAYGQFCAIKGKIDELEKFDREYEECIRQKEWQEKLNKKKEEQILGLGI